MKPFFKSSTLWINAIAFVIIGLQFIQNTSFFGVDPEIQALIVAVINFLNRFRTTEPVG